MSDTDRSMSDIRLTIGITSSLRRRCAAERMLRGNQSLVFVRSLIGTRAAAEIRKSNKKTFYDVLMESGFLGSAQRPLAVQEMLAGFISGAFQLRQLEPESLFWISKFLRKYENIRAQLADATINVRR